MLTVIYCARLSFLIAFLEFENLQFLTSGFGGGYGRNAISFCIMATFITLCLIHVHLTVLNFSLCFSVLV